MLIRLLLALASHTAHPDVDARFETRTLVRSSIAAQVSVHVAPKISVNRCEEHNLIYRLYVPTQRRNSKHYPLIIWLHGRDEAGSNHRDHLAWIQLLLGTGTSPRFLDAYILARQCPRNGPSWGQTDAQGNDPLNDLELIVDHVMANHPIDPQRILLVGISQGATGAWEYLRRYPDRFAGLLSLAATDIRDVRPSTGCSTPIWAIHSQADGEKTISRTKSAIDAIREEGGIAHLSLVDSPDHDCWTVAFRELQADRWLLRMRRKLASATPIRLVLATTTALGLAGYLATFWNRRLRRIRGNIDTASRDDAAIRVGDSTYR